MIRRTNVNTCNIHLVLFVIFIFFIGLCSGQQVTWVGQPVLQATSPGHFALTWTAADLSGVPDSINIQFRYDANPNNVASIELPGTATSYVLPVEEPIDLNEFQIAVFAVTGGVPADATVAQIGGGDPRLPPQPSGTVTQPSATTYRISGITGATPRENYVVWAYPIGGDPATNPYIRMELPAGTTTFDVNNLAPDASQYDLSLFTIRDGIQSEAAVLVFQQDDIQLPPATVEAITTDAFSIAWVNGPPTFNDGRRVTHYRVTVTPADGSAVQMFDVPAAALASHRFMGLSTGISHNVQIDAVVSNNGVQEVVDLTTMTDVITLPNPPQNVILRQTSPTMVTITWDPPVDGNYDEYYLFYQGQNVGDNEATLSKTTNGFILDGLRENEEYRFMLFSQVMPDTLSDLADITFIPLEIDANVQIGALTDHGMQVTWDAVQNAQSYSVTVVGRDGSQQTVTVPGDTTEYTFTGLTANTEYQALVDVIVNGQEGLAGSAMGVTKTAGNVQSSNVQANSMDISFDNVAGATGYLVSIISDDGTDVRVLQSTGSPQTITGLNANTNYQIGVDAIIGGVRTEIGALAEMTTGGNQVTNLNLGTVTTDIIQVDWTQIPGASSYILTLTDESGQTPPQTVTITDPTTIAHAFQNLNPGQDYSISLTGIGAGGAPVDGGTVMATTMPLPPRNVEVTATSATSATLQWQPPAGGTYDGFLIVHGPTDGSAPPTLVPVPQGSTTHTLNGINTATDFVSLYTTSGEQISVPGFPQDESMVTVTDKTDTSLTVMWTPSDTANTYQIMLIDNQGNIVEVIEAPNHVTDYMFNALTTNTEYTAVITSIDEFGDPFPVGQVTDTTGTTVVDFCTPSPCLNGGVCVNGANTFICQCPTGFTGTRCETNIDDCVPNQCLNGGVCVDGINMFTCQCPQGFSGTLCEIGKDQ
ncbi:tenascin-like [Amphiura filiformis]|uniref:tenascin-like n=1 Tax=Amphiura filiformis TaxID=82378 RepID=UPI003B2287BE